MVNTLCQGSAADLIKRAMLVIDAALVPTEGAGADAGEGEGAGAGAGEGEGGNTLHRAETGRLLLQVHDELVFEVAEAHAPRLRALVRRSMQEAAQLRVPLFVKVQQGPSWGELREIAG